MIDQVFRARGGQLGAPAPSAQSADRDGDHDRLGSVFQELPSDAGHWGVPYFEHVLNPLRHVPPDYVLEIEAGEVDADDLATDMPEDVAGVVVVRLPQNG